MWNSGQIGYVNVFHYLSSITVRNSKLCTERTTTFLLKIISLREFWPNANFLLVGLLLALKRLSSISTETNLKEEEAKKRVSDGLSHGLSLDKPILDIRDGSHPGEVVKMTRMKIYSKYFPIRLKISVSKQVQLWDICLVTFSLTHSIYEKRRITYKPISVHKNSLKTT